LTDAVCNRVKKGARGVWHCRCPSEAAGVQPMLMFKRSQLYIGLALAALVQIVVVARFLMH